MIFPPLSEYVVSHTVTRLTVCASTGNRTVFRHPLAMRGLVPIQLRMLRGGAPLLADPGGKHEGAIQCAGD